MNILQNYLQMKGVQLMTQKTDNNDDRYHSHLFFEIFYIVSGSIEHEVNDERSLLSLGDICFLRPGDNHTFHREFGNNCEHRDILLSTELVKRTCDFLDETFLNVLTSSKQPFSFKLSQAEYNTLEAEFTAFSDLQATAIGVDLSAKENYLAVVLFNMIISRLQNYNAKNLPDWLQRLITQLNDKDNFVKQINEILEGISYNQCYISRAFSKHIGMTISQYFNNAKIFYSVKLLRFSQMSISEIAISSGFDSITYYNRVFKKHFGVSPTEYRNNVVKASPKGAKGKIRGN